MTRQLVSLPGNLLPSTVMATPGKAARNNRSAANGAALLTSRDNRWLKEFRVALRGGLPTENGFVGVEGVRLVEEALRSGCRIQTVLFSESGERHHERLSSFIDRPEMAFPVLRTTDRLFEGLADTEHPQGVAALVHPRETSFDDFVRDSPFACAPLLVVLAGEGGAQRGRRYRHPMGGRNRIPDGGGRRSGRFLRSSPSKKRRGRAGHPNVCEYATVRKNVSLFSKLPPLPPEPDVPAANQP